MNLHNVSSFNFFLCLLIFCFSSPSATAQKHHKELPSSAGKSVYGFNPEFEKVKSRVSYVPGIKVIRGETHVIVPEQEFFCPAGSVFKYNNGDIQVFDRRSNNGGKTWRQVAHILENSTYQFPAPDGEVVMFQSDNAAGGSTSAGRPEISLQKSDEVGVLVANFFRSNDNGLSRKSDPARIYLPEIFRDWSGVLCRNIVGLNDGSLLMSMYLRSGDKKSVENKFRDIVLKSTDRGKTWHYLSTVAFDMSEDNRGEGFNEASLLVRPDGKINCYMRSGASYQASLGSSNNNDWDNKMPFSFGQQTPIYKSVSVDGGKSWSIPDPITSHGVWPDTALMKNGITALTYGRPGNWIMFNEGESDNWGPIIPFYNDLYPPDCGNYVSVAEVAPDILLVVYSRTNPNDHWKSELVGTYFNVKAMKE
ncbi:MULTISPECIES: sialidase family protein [Arenibacter]|uniref:sialidase family protein n=1 Tax=Arenibacter TaxID=178469 RepID=UPI0012FFE595|nr:MULTISPECIES: sialidase family protein [Arenibacter]